MRVVVEDPVMIELVVSDLETVVDDDPDRLCVIVREVEELAV